MKQAFIASVKMWIALTLLCGAAYPLMVTAYAQLLFPTKAKGSLIERDGKIVGSELVGQSFTSNKYFWSRPSATNPPYNAAASGASNLPPNSAQQKNTVKERRAHFARTIETPHKHVPLDMLTASGSGLDPHISPESAYLQVPRVAKARKLTREEVTQLVTDHLEDRQFELLGDKRINILRLNLALDAYEQR